MASQRLTRDFYSQDSIAVARGLLGARLVHRLADGTRLSGRIVETEAYLGVHDPAAHSFNGRRTPRTEVMYGDPGLSYIYFIYGMYFCFNVVTTARDIPEAVLVRAMEPVEGLPTQDFSLASGPGKLCRALQLTKMQNHLNLVVSSELWIEDDVEYSDAEIVDGPRVGINYAEDAVHWPLRFGVRNHSALSRPRFPSEGS